MRDETLRSTCRFFHSCPFAAPDRRRFIRNRRYDSHCLVHSHLLYPNRRAPILASQIQMTGLGNHLGGNSDPALGSGLSQDVRDRRSRFKALIGVRRQYQVHEKDLYRRLWNRRIPTRQSLQRCMCDESRSSSGALVVHASGKDLVSDRASGSTQRLCHSPSAACSIAPRGNTRSSRKGEAENSPRID